MIEQMMRECNNFFEDGFVDGEFAIENGVLSPVDGIRAAYVAISGSTYHDGVYRMEDGCLRGAERLIDEHFRGRVYALRPPAAFVALAQQVAEFVEKMPSAAVASESFGMYSRTLRNGRNGGALTWQEAFSGQLKPYRRMFTGVHV